MSGRPTGGPFHGPTSRGPTAHLRLFLQNAMATLKYVARIYLETSFVSACVSTRTTLRSRYEREASLLWWGTEAGAPRCH